jgi:hypothetical protein
VPNPDNPNWLDATTTAAEALDTAKLALATERAHFHLTILLLTAFAKTAPPETISQLMEEIERVRDLTGPAGRAAGEVFATAASTLERFAPHR